MTKAIVLLTNTFIIALHLRNCVQTLRPILRSRIIPLWWCPQPIVSAMTRCVVRESEIYIDVTQMSQRCLLKKQFLFVLCDAFAVCHNDNQIVFPQELKHDVYLLLHSFIHAIKKSSLWEGVENAGRGHAPLSQSVYPIKKTTPNTMCTPYHKVYPIRESVDPLCRDGADTPIVRVHRKAFLREGES